MAECPFCKEKVGANDFLPSETAACSVCGKRPVASAPSEPWWVSAAASEGKRSVVAPLTPPEPAVASQPKEAESVPKTTAPSVPPPRVAPNKTPPPREESLDDDEPRSFRDQVRGFDLGSVLAFLCLSLALLFCSFYQLEAFIKPTAAAGLLAGLFLGAVPALWRRKKIVPPILVSVLCLLVLLFAGSWPKPSGPPSVVAVPLKPKGMAAHQAAGEEDWMDASVNAVKRGDVRVEIVSASFGPVDIKRRSSVTSSAGRCLMIRLRVSHEGIVFQQTPYEPWSDRADSPSKHPPTLTDDQGRSYAQKTFGPGWKVSGQVENDALNPGHQVKEVLVYPLPARDVKHLRLMLPASAFGQSGEFRFQIPRSMITGL